MHVASALVGIDEENFLVIEKPATKWRWLVRPTLPKRARFPSEAQSRRIFVLGEMEVKENGVRVTLDLFFGALRCASALSTVRFLNTILSSF
jgi:hypothetical protein